MGCVIHEYGWPRRQKDGSDLQTCVRCGATKVCRIDFDATRHPVLRWSGKPNPIRRAMAAEGKA